MKWILYRYVAVTYLRFFLAIFGVVLAIFLMADFVDRSKFYSGPGWVSAVIELYAHKALLAIRQLAPAAMLLGAGAAVSALRKSGEVTALRSLGFGPRAVYAPIGVTAAAMCLGLIVFDEKVVVPAGVRVDEITVGRFNTWGDWSFFFVPKRWFRVEDRIFHLRVGESRTGYEDVTVLTVSKDFKLRARMDAQTLRWVEGTTWRLTSVVERTFDDRGGTQVRTAPSLDLDLKVAGDAFYVRTGRPEQMYYPELLEQIEIRKAVGISSQIWALALHNRLAYPLAGLPAALLAIGLALRPGRRGHLTLALVEGLIVVTAMWGLMVISRALVVGERLEPAAAAWMPTVLLSLGAAALWLRREGRLGWRGA
ncbi:MAG: LptF/LptG family permease [Myxococcota bacterium]|nr:LptF/LptG family permease [Myxococcota bacterium]